MIHPEREVQYGIWYKDIDPATKKVVGHGLIATSLNKNYAEWVKRALEAYNHSPDREFLVIVRY